MIQYDVSISIVLYKNDPGILQKTIESALRTSLLVKLYLIDNSPTDSLKLLSTDSRIEYVFNNANIGFGKAHNIALRQTLDTSRYHIVLNPDVYFEEGTLEALFDYMQEHVDVGLIMPRVLSFEGELQFLCKRIPSPIELVARRFLPEMFWLNTNMRHRYEMHDKNYNKIFEAPTLSGCFMFLRTQVLGTIGLFDERYFMYMEDIDLSRRMYKRSKNIYFPMATIYHGHAKESYTNVRLLKIHIRSAVHYFNKWGWFFDSERKIVNSKV